MKKLASLSISALALVLLGACSNTDNSKVTKETIPGERPTATIIINSRASGPLTVATFNGGDIFATDTKSADNLKILVKHENTPTVICIDNPVYYELATASSVPPGNGYRLCAVTRYTSGVSQTVSISVFSHIAYSLSKYLVSTGVSPGEAVKQANNRVTNWLTIPIPSTAEIDISNPDNVTAIISDGHTLSFLIAGISKVTNAIAIENGAVGHNNIYNSLALAKFIEDDLADGVFDALSKTGEIYSGAVRVSTDYYRGKFANSIFDVVNGSLNKSGLTGVDIKTTVISVGQSEDSIFNNQSPVAFNQAPTIASDYDFTERLTGTNTIVFDINISYGIKDITFTVGGIELVYKTIAPGVYGVTFDSTLVSDGFPEFAAAITDIMGNKQTYTKTVEIFNAPVSLYDGNTFVTGGEVVAYDYSGGTKGTEIIRAFTDIKGVFNIDLYAHAKPVLFELTGGRMIEFASGVDVPLTNIDTLSMVVNHIPGSSQLVNINVLTSVARGLADYGVKSNMAVDRAVVLANFDVSKMLGFDIIPTIPANISIVSGENVLNTSTRYGFMLAAFSQLTYNLSVGFEAKPHATINSLAITRLAVEDITADGLLDGLGRGASQLSLAGLNVDANTYRHLGAIGIVQFSENSRNKSPFSTADVLMFAANLNNSTNYLFGDLGTVPIDGGGATINNFTAGSQPYKTDIFTLTADIADLIGVSSVELLVDSTFYGYAADLINPSFNINSLDFIDCNCQFTIRVTNINGTITSKTIGVQIDNKRFIYVGGAGTTVYSYNPSMPGSEILVETNPVDPIAALHPSGQFMYTTTQKRFNLHDFNGGLTTFDNVAFDTGPNYYHHLIGKKGKYLYISNAIFQLGPDQGELKAYSINPDTTLTQVGPTIVLPGRSRGVMAQNPAFPFLYLAQQRNNKVSVNKINADGSLSEMVGLEVTGNTPTSLLVNKAGTTLFVLYSMGNVVVKYRINSDGSLLFSDSVAAGFRPVQMVFDKDESFVYVLAKYPTTVSVFAVSPSTGNLIEKTGSPYAINVPNYGLDDIAFGAGGDVLFLNGADGLQAYQNQIDGIAFGSPDWETPSGAGAIYTTRGGINKK